MSEAAVVAGVSRVAVYRALVDGRLFGVDRAGQVAVGWWWVWPDDLGMWMRGG